MPCGRVTFAKQHFLIATANVIGPAGTVHSQPTVANLRKANNAGSQRKSIYFEKYLGIVQGRENEVGNHAGSTKVIALHFYRSNLNGTRF
jgi:hypothetical protein